MTRIRNAVAGLGVALAGLAQAGEIVVFEHGNFQGRQLNVRAAVNDLDPYAFRNTVSSLSVKSGSWELCTDSGHRGYCQIFGPGNYADLGEVNDRFNSLREVTASQPIQGGSTFKPFFPGSSGVGELTLFEHANFQGRSAVLRAELPDFSAQGFNDQTSSLIVSGGSWELCVDGNFGPPCVTFNAGEHRVLDGQFNDRFSSARPLRLGSTLPGGSQPGEGARTVGVILFENDNFDGRAKTLSASTSSFDAIGFNDATSSLIVTSGSWQFCTDGNYQGECITYPPGEYRTVPPQVNDRFSSARQISGAAHSSSPSRPSGARGAMVTLFEYADFGGRSHAANNAQANLSDFRFNDRAASVIIERGNWEFCTDASYRGDCRILGPGQYRSLPTGFDNSISSLRPR